MPTVKHFDIPVDDVNRVQNFYYNIFGWDMKKVKTMTTANIELWLCETKNVQAKNGISRSYEKSVLSTVTNYIEVSSIEKYTEKINLSGGKITGPRTEISSIEFFAMFLYSEANLFGLFEEGTK